MLVEVKDLNVGDEILISVNSQFRYLRVLKQPRVGKRLHWKTKQPLYTAVKCSTRMENVNHTWTSHSGKQLVRTYREYIFTDIDHNTELTIDLNHRGIFLIRKTK